jgi:plasmid stability protein
LASFTIRNLDDALKERLRSRAAEHDRSMEDEVREIPRTALSAGNEMPVNFADALRNRFGPLGGVDLPPIPLEPLREPPKFEE